VRFYADTSFILRVITPEDDSGDAVGELRRLERPQLFYTALHGVELQTSIRQRAFHDKRSAAPDKKAHVLQRRDRELARLAALRERGAFLEVEIDFAEAFLRAEKLAVEHGERLGLRAIDVIHVACSVELEAEFFLSTDVRQRQLAEAVGLSVRPKRL
jgi:hypothetical protein